MARPTFKPDATQLRAMRELGRATTRAKAADAYVTLVILRAKEDGVPVEHIAKAAGLAVKTIYNRMARGLSPWPKPDDSPVVIDRTADCDHGDRTTTVRA